MDMMTLIVIHDKDHKQVIPTGKTMSIGRIITQMRKPMVQQKNRSERKGSVRFSKLLMIW